MAARWQTLVRRALSLLPAALACMGPAPRAGLRREEVFITTKLWPPDAWGYEPAKAALRASLERLGTSYVDLALLHAPGPVESRGDTWRALEDCAAAGLVRSLGVSNFGVAQLQRLAAGARLAPAVNQLELHPWRRWPAEEAYCRKRGLALQAYSPLACGERLGGATLAEVATRVGRSPAQARGQGQGRSPRAAGAAACCMPLE